MIVIRRSGERGKADHGWLETRHSFSFANYHDPQHMGFRTLRVINEDWVQPDSGFGTHSHQDMEILTYVISGSLAHKDSMGNGSTLGPGDVQRMTAGTGVQHSEMNPSTSETVHLLQIWILPGKAGLKPDYEEKHIPESAKVGRLTPIASAAGESGALMIHQDVAVYATVLKPAGQVIYPISPGRHAWVQVVIGSLELNGEKLVVGDGAAISDEAVLTMKALEKSEAILFDLS